MKVSWTRPVYTLLLLALTANQPSCITQDDDDDQPTPASHVYYGDGEDCGTIGSAFWNHGQQGVFVQAYSEPDVCARYLGIVDAVNDHLADYITDSLEAEASMDGQGACDALLALHQNLDGEGYYAILFPAGSCRFYAYFEELTSNPMSFAGAPEQPPVAQFYGTDSDVLPAIDAYLGGCNLIESWAQWSALYYGFVDQEYWPGEIYEATSGDVNLTFELADRFVLEVPAARMTSVLTEGVQTEVDVRVDAHGCAW